MIRRLQFLTSFILLTSTFFIPGASFAEEEKEPAIGTNIWVFGAEEYTESVSFIMADGIEADGRAYDDVFWMAGQARVDGRFDNDVWLLASQASLGGQYEDHLRVLGQKVEVSGNVSNGFWAVGGSITATTNSVLNGDHLFLGNNLTLLGNIEGNVHARAQRITLGGTMVGNITVYGDEIMVRPGTTIVGNFVYVTTNQTIVLDSESNVTGIMKHIDAEVATSLFAPKWNLMFELYLLGAAILVGFPFIMLFPGPTGSAIRALRVNLIRCGMVGLLFIILVPILILLAAMSVLGLPLALVLGATYGLILYLGKFSVALAVGSSILGRRGQISTTGALLSLVVGLFVFYSIAVIPFVGGSLQIVAIAFGTGSLALTIFAKRGRVKQSSNIESK